MKPKIFCFDVDRTLVPGNSWQRLTEGLGASWLEHLSIYERMLSGKISAEESCVLLRDLYWATRRANRVFINSVLYEVEPHPEAIELFKFLKSSGCKVYLVSAGPDAFVRYVARRLSANGWYSNGTFHFSDHGFLTRIVYDKMQSDLKVKQVMEIAERNQLDIRDIVFVGDSENDYGAFVATGRGIAIDSQSEDLKRFAWKTVNNLKEIFPITEELLTP